MSSPTSEESSFLGHPRGLATLFFTEMWERFSYYGMKALLILFMTGSTVQGGMGFDTATAAAIFGLYTAGVYLLALPGGYLADRLWGQQRAVLYGGMLIAAGHFSLAVPSKLTFFAGLVLIVLGTGLLKPNISILVGRLYASDDDRREAGFSLFYMGINLGGFLAPLVCGTLGEKIDWHWGFGAAGVGMVLGLVQFVMGQKTLKGPGMEAHQPPPEPVARKIRVQIVVGLGLGALVAVGLGIGWIPLTAVQLANVAAIAIVSMGDRIFHLPVDHGRPRRGGKEEGGGDRHVVRFLGYFLGGIRAGRLVPEYFCPRYDRSSGGRLGIPRQLVPIREFPLCDAPGSGFCGPLDPFGLSATFCAGEIRPRFDLARRGFSGADPRCSVGGNRRKSRPGVVGCRLFSAYLWRALLVSGGFEHGDPLGAGTICRSDDGGVVHLHVSGQPSGGIGGGKDCAVVDVRGVLRGSGGLHGGRSVDGRSRCSGEGSHGARHDIFHTIHIRIKRGH